MKFAIVLLLAAVPFFAQAGTCPLGEHDDHLTLPRVMVNFGRFTTDADLVSLKLNDPWKPIVTDAEITAAAVRLGGAIDCADAVLAHPEGDLLPGYLDKLSKQAREEAVEDFVSFMSDFRDLLALYQKSLFDYVAAPLEKRDATTMDRIRHEIDDTVDHAHRKTTPDFLNAALPESLESLMKQIKTLFKQIIADAADETKSAGNAASALQIASLFRKSALHTPEAIDKMPVAQRAQALIEYKQMIEAEAVSAEKLAEAFQKKDRAAIDALLKEMGRLKEEGHDRFDP